MWQHTDPANLITTLYFEKVTRSVLAMHEKHYPDLQKHTCCIRKRQIIDNCSTYTSKPLKNY